MDKILYLTYIFNVQMCKENNYQVSYVDRKSLLGTCDIKGFYKPGNQC